MKVKGLDGRTHVWSLPPYVFVHEISCSDLHTKLRTLLRGLFPTDRVLEEVTLPGSGVAGDLRLDFFLPLRRLAVEAHGRQHYEFVAHFHGDQRGFQAHRRRDENKKLWCATNAIDLVGVPHWLSDEDMTTLILARGGIDGGEALGR